MIFGPSKFILGAALEVVGYVNDRVLCWVAGHDDVWVRRSTGPRCECDRCGRPV